MKTLLKNKMKLPTFAAAAANRLLCFWNGLVRVLDQRSFLFCFLASPAINLLVEMLSRRSPLKGFEYMIQSPGPFLYNCVLIFVTLLAASIFKKRVFSILFVSALWIWAGIVNCSLLGMRVTPFGATDILNMKSGLDLIDLYMTPFQIALAVGGVVLFIVVTIWLWLKSPKCRGHYLKRGAVFTAAAFSFSILTALAVRSGTISESFGNLADSYKQYGFAYCFAKSVVDMGVDRPDTYSEQTLNQLTQELENAQSAAGESEERPNIIFVQLESLFDVNRLNNLTFSSNPIPNLTRLRQEYSSGLFTVPSIGAGTVNTEFEAMTGMSLAYFGTGEYPFKTILRSSVSPSICYDLEEYGYTSHAIHNHKGSFYDRNKVYPNLGFDDFTSIEYMDNIRKTPLGWAKDSILTEQVIKALDSTEGSDYIYTVTAQPHGKYPTSGDYDLPIAVYGAKDTETAIQWQYYVSQIYETDNFVGSLVKALENRGEPYICVFYGDHLPSLSVEDEQLSYGTNYQTEYVIVTNMDIEKQDEDICAYQLSAKVLEMAGLKGGIMPTLHQTFEDDGKYYEYMELLEYDILYGDHISLGGEMPYEPTEMTMGIDEIYIEKAYLTEEGLVVEGVNITDKSEIFVNGKPFGKTERVDKGVLISDDTGISEGDIVQVAQVGTDGEPLSYTSEFVFHE